MIDICTERKQRWAMVVRSAVEEKVYWTKAESSYGVVALVVFSSFQIVSCKFWTISTVLFLQLHRTGCRWLLEKNHQCLPRGFR
ncbi:hypothetical protein K1719_005547 [Acacia pycnantha]|nr:hypothetical protein K1719_005547 [Acacia pycnantha]